jgi:hypothetical protein
MKTIGLYNQVQVRNSEHPYNCVYCFNLLHYVTVIILTDFFPCKDIDIVAVVQVIVCTMQRTQNNVPYKQGNRRMFSC